MELESIPFETRPSLDIEPYPWHGFGFLDKLIALALPVLAIATFALPFVNLSILRRLAGIPGMDGVLDWLLNGNGSWIAGTALVVLWIGFLYFRRWRIISDEHQWVDAGCPQCQENELVRVSRERSDRWYGLLSIPAYRYACRNCTWRGLRIAHRHRHHVLAQEEMITASSLTLEAVGVDNELAPEPAEVASFDQDLPLVDYETGLLTEESLQTDTDTALELASNEVASTVPNNHQGQADDDLEWLWRRLSDD